LISFSAGLRVCPRWTSCPGRARQSSARLFVLLQTGHCSCLAPRRRYLLLKKIPPALEASGLIGSRDGHSFATQRIACLIVCISLRPSTLNGKSDSDISSVSVGDTGAKSDRTACKRASSVQSAQSNPTPSRTVSTDCFFGACSAFTHVVACTLAESPSDPLHRKLRQLRFLRCRFDCYRVERTGSRAGVHPLKSSAFHGALFHQLPR